MCTVILPPGDNPIVVNKYIKYPREKACDNRRVSDDDDDKELQETATLCTAHILRKYYFKNIFKIQNTLHVPQIVNIE